MNKFNVGDKVIVTGNGGDYTTYTAMAKKMELKNWKSNESVPLNSILKVDVTAKHMNNADVVYAVSDSDGNQYLVSNDFMVLVSVGCNTKQSTAIDTLELMGYEWHDGEWIKQKPVEYEYIKVTDSIFDLRPDFEAGELYFAANGDMDNMRVIETEWHLVQLLKHQLEYTDRSYIYRKVEKQVDWRDDVYDYLGDCQWFDGNTSIGNALMSEHASSAFLELCRIALRARGEL